MKDKNRGLDPESGPPAGNQIKPPKKLLETRKSFFFHLSNIIFIGTVVAGHIRVDFELRLHTVRLDLRGTEAVRIVVWSAT